MLNQRKVRSLAICLVLSISPFLQLRRAIASEQKLTYLFDLSGKKLAQIEGRPYRWSPNGQYMTIESNNFQWFYLYDSSGKQLQKLTSGNVEFSQDGKRIAVLSQGKNELYDAPGRKLAQFPQRILRSLIFSQNSQRILTLNDPGASLFDADGREIAQIQGEFLEIGSGLDATGKSVILTQIAPRDQAGCHLFHSGKLVARLLNAACFGMNPVGESFFVSIGTLENPVMALYSFSGKKIAQLAGVVNDISLVRKRILTTSILGRSSYLFDSKGQQIAVLKGKNGRFSPDGDQIVTIDGDVVRLYDGLGRAIAQVPGSFAVFLPDSRRFATYLPRSDARPPANLFGGQWRLFARSGQEIARLKGDALPTELLFSGVESLDPLNQFSPSSRREISFFSADGELILTNDAQHSYLYNTAGQEIAKLPGTSPRFSPTGSHLMTQTENRVYAFDRSGKKILEMQGKYGFFSPNGQRIGIVTESKHDRTR